MRLRNPNKDNERRFVSLRAAADYMGVGTQTAKATAVKIGAERRIGTRCVYDLQKFDDYFADHYSIELSAVVPGSNE